MAWKKVLLEGDAAVLSDTTPAAITENATGSAGSATEASRQDHVHASPATWAPSAHKTSHEDGGADEISVAGLAGLLADDQHVLDSEVTTVIEATPLNDLAEADGIIACGQQQLDGAVLECAATAPDSGTEVEGQMYYNTGDDHPYIYVGA